MVAIVPSARLDGQKEIRAVRLAAGASAVSLSASAVDDANGRGKKVADFKEGVKERGSLRIQGGDLLA